MQNLSQTLKECARIICCQNASVPLPLILDVGFNDLMAYDAMISLEPTGHSHHDDHSHNHDHHGHDRHSHHLENDGFVSVSYRSDRPFALRQFEQFLETLPAEVFRAKGLLWFSESPNKHIFQLSGKRCTLDVESWHSVIPGNQIVFIGRHLNVDRLREQLAACQV